MNYIVIYSTTLRPTVLESYNDLDIALDRAVALCNSKEVAADNKFRITPLEDDAGWDFINKPGIYIAVLKKTPITSDVKKFRNSFFGSPSTNLSAYQQKVNEQKGLPVEKPLSLQEIVDMLSQSEDKE